MSDEEHVVVGLAKVCAIQGLSERALAPNKGNPFIIASGGGIDRRMLPHMSMMGFYELYLGHCQARNTCRRENI